MVVWCQTMTTTHIPGFTTLGGKHCQTASLRHTLHHFGCFASEEMLLGLGGGIGFIYWYAKNMNAPFIGTRGAKSDDFFAKAAERVGASASVRHTTSEKKAHAALISQLEEGIPTIVYADMAHLPYMYMPPKSHFGEHTVTVFSLDEKTQEVMVADRSKYPFTLTIGELRAARGSTAPPFPARNRWIEMEVPDEWGITIDALKASILECANGMLDPPISNLGLAGMEKWAMTIPKWPAMFSEESLFECLYNTMLYIEQAGTGGSAFRKMYASFLREAFEWVCHDALIKAAEDFDEAALMWSDIANVALPEDWDAAYKVRSLTEEQSRVFEEQGPEALKQLEWLSEAIEEAIWDASQTVEQHFTVERIEELQKSIRTCRALEYDACLSLRNAVK